MGYGSMAYLISKQIWNLRPKPEKSPRVVRFVCRSAADFGRRCAQAHLQRPGVQACEFSAIAGALGSPIGLEPFGENGGEGSEGLGFGWQVFEGCFGWQELISFVFLT